MRHFIITLEDGVDTAGLPDSAVEIALNSMDSLESLVMPMEEVINCYNLCFPFNCVGLYKIHSESFKYTGTGARRKEWEELSHYLKQLFIDCVEIDTYYDHGQNITRTYSVFATDEMREHLDSYYHSLSYHQLPLEI